MFKKHKNLGKDMEAMKNLIYYREVVEIRLISKRLQKKVIDEEKKFFDVWMSDVNDDIQCTAESFAERFFLQ
jgi:hypothetical protein